MIAATGFKGLSQFRKDPAKNARRLLIELLAWQFASPVRWIETQEYLADEVEQLIEVGPAAAPVLSNMFRSSTRARDVVPPVLHGTRDFADVIGIGPEPADEQPPAVAVESTPVTQATVPHVQTVNTGPVASAAPIDDEPWGIAHALTALLALRAGQSIDSVGQSDTIDGLLGGNSARRNQVLLDLGKEFGVGPVDGAHELPISELTDAISRSGGARYRHPGAILKAAQTQALGTLGLGKKAALSQLNERYGLEEGRGDAVLSTLASESDQHMSDADPLKVAAQSYARRAGISLEKRTATAGPAVAVDAGALKATEGKIRQSWLTVARSALRAADIDPLIIDKALTATPSTPVAKQESKLSRFAASAHVAYTAVEQWQRVDTLALVQTAKTGQDCSHLIERLARSGDQASLDMLDYFLTTTSKQSKFAKRLKQARSTIEKAMTQPLSWADQTALVTGAGPDSIAEGIVKRLLEGGARVVVTTSRPSRDRLKRFKGLYRTHGARGSELHIVPFNQGDFADIDALCEWMLASSFETRGAARIQLKTPWLPTLCFPFGAVPAEGDPTTLDESIADTLKVNLIGVERLIGKLAVEISQRGADTKPVHIVLPLSPNHGQMGRDGLYAESKIGLETLLRRWGAEFDRWGKYTTLCGARIGWVRGTGLMHGLDRVYKRIENDLGIETYSPTEMADLILGHCDENGRANSAEAPIVADLTGGFGKATGLRDLINHALENAQSQLGPVEPSAPSTSLPLNLFEFPALPKAATGKAIDPAHAVAIVGFGEIGPFGNARARWSIEKSQRLTSADAIELAWLCGHIKFENGEWLDLESGDTVDVNDLVNTYDLNSAIGIRENAVFDPNMVEAYSEVLLSEDLVFHVPDADIADSFKRQDPANTHVVVAEDGFKVVRKAGARVRVPRIDPIDRDIAGQLPAGFDPTRLGFDSQQLEQIDPVAIYNLLATAEAFRTAGIDPRELWAEIHPSRIACTQGSGIGGMRALRRLYADSVLDQNKQSDVLQETLINVGAAYPGMYIYGGYGPMINPVSACATAAVSVEVASDLLTARKADFVVAGAFDDFSKEGARGFAEMQATISADERARRGFDPDQSSRPCDARRGGFVESQGGGTILLCRGDTAIELGLPIYGLVAGAWSAADGLQKSVPAPGPGVSAIGAGGLSSPLGQALDTLGLGADDIGVVSIHGTSTDANDLNETQLHSNLAKALGRSAGNPLPVIGQKAITGHAKGGAAAWQLIGLCQSLNEGIIPPMHNLDEPDRRLDDRAPLLFSDETLNYGPGAIRAGILTSLGFGHVGAAVCVANANVLLEGLSETELEYYSQRRDARWNYQLKAQYSVMLGEQQYFGGGVDKTLSADQEYELLLDPNGRIVL